MRKATVQYTCDTCGDVFKEGDAIYGYMEDCGEKKLPGKRGVAEYQGCTDHICDSCLRHFEQLRDHWHNHCGMPVLEKEP